MNLGSAGAELWALYQAAETCRHCLSTEVKPNSIQLDERSQVARGLVYGLTHARMLSEATQVYRVAVSWGGYPRQVCDCSLLIDW